MKKFFTSIAFAFIVAKIFSQYPEIYPTNWWVGMKWNKVQLLIRGKDIFNNEKVRINYPGVSVTNIHQFQNGKYLAVDVTIASSTTPGTVNIEFTNNGKTNTVAWEL